VGHFAAILGEVRGLYVLKDPVLGVDVELVSKKALDEQASGYFLARKDDTRSGAWRKVSALEAGGIWGSGPTVGQRRGRAGDVAANCPGRPTVSPLMGRGPTNIKEMAVGLMLSDTRVGYPPPIGPAVPVTLTYNQREDSQPPAMPFSNISPQ